MTYPDLVCSGPVFFMVGHATFLIPPYMPQIFPVSCLGDYVSVTVWYDETVVVVGLAVKLAV